MNGLQKHKPPILSDSFEDTFSQKWVPYDKNVISSKHLEITIEATPMQVNFQSVIVSQDKVEQIKAAVSQLANHEKIFEQWGFDEVFEKGTAVSLLFHGIPGTGKTLMAQAIADMLEYELRILGSGDIETSEPGGAERTIKKLFKIANVRMALKRGWSARMIEEKFGVNVTDDPEEITNPMTNEVTKVPPDERWHGKPQVLLFDECDSLLVDRNDVGMILAAHVNALLTQLERFEGVVVLTTNRLGKLDAALERRITAKIEFEFPTKEQRTAIWRRMIPKKAPIADDVNFEELGEFPLVGGNIKNCVLNAARSAAYAGLTQINKASFTQAIEKEIEGLQQFVSTYEQEQNIKRIRSLLHDPGLGGMGAGMGASTEEHMGSELKIVQTMEPKRVVTTTRRRTVQAIRRTRTKKG